MTTVNAPDRYPPDIVTAVREATVTAPKRTPAAFFSLIKGSPVEAIIAPVVGLYLGYAVIRLPEVFTAVAVPHLPMILMLVFIAILGFAIPGPGWALIWDRSKPLRLVAALLVVAIVTVPIGIWPSASLLFIREHYIVTVLIFVTCLVLLRDRRNFRIAVTVYVLCTAAVCVNVLKTYDPNAVVYDEDGNPIPEYRLEERPELRRLKAVGVSLDPNDFGAVLVVTFPLALWLSMGNVRRRIFWTGIAGLMVAAVVPTQSRGAELGFVAVALVIVAAGARGWRRWVTGIAVAGCTVLFVMMATGIGAGNRFTDFNSDDYNVAGNEGRMFFWRQGMVWMLKRPWGYGIENYSTYFGILNGQERAAHSSWVQYGMELGIAGLVLFVLLCWTLIRRLRSLRKQAAALRQIHPAARSEEMLAGHMLAVVTGALVTGSFLSNAYYPLMYMALGMAAATILGSPLVDALPPPSSSTEKALHPRAQRRLRQFPGSEPSTG